MSAESAAIDLNADAGESEPLARDEALLEVVTSVNLACGVHAGSEESIARLSAAALSRGVGVGAHPGLPIGRGAAVVTPDEARDAVISQVRIFRRAAKAPLQHVKLHGTLYHAARDRAVARAVVEAILDVGSPILVAQAGSPLLLEGRAKGIEVRAEAFLDRAYGPDGLLVPRDRPGALVTDPAAAVRRALRIVLDHRLETTGGGEISLQADTLCIHGDTPDALSLARAVRRALTEAGVRLRPLGRR
jgi:5-oxoprolinase (ATP-hydrolysing) subunit A